MSGYWLTQLAIVTLNIFLVVLFVMGNSDFCGSVFETQVDHVLLGHIMSKADVVDEFECQLKCLGNNSCKSFNVHPNDNNANRICELNNKTRHMKPGDFKWKKGSTYYGSVQVSCMDVSRERTGQTKSGQCHPGYKGTQCQTQCLSPLGMENYKITSAQISASSQWDGNHSPNQGRLHFKATGSYKGGWSSKTNNLNQWFQIDLRIKTTVTFVATQGRNQYDQWVTEYKLQYSNDGNSFQGFKQEGDNSDKVFVGNNDADTVVKRAVIPPITARYIRLIPTKWTRHISMRMELYGCFDEGSCMDIRDLGGSKGDGEYWIDPEKSGNPLKVFCDMKTDGGGWLLVSNVVVDSPSSRQLSVETSYRGITSYHSNKTFLTKSAMHELWTHLHFTQLRFHCSKQQGRTFHVTTATNSTGEAVVQYFSGQTDVQPPSCGSYVRMENDNSLLAGVCDQWGRENGVYKVGKWGHGEDQNRLYNHAAFAAGLYHWLLTPDGSRWECDDVQVGVSSGDFWKVFVR